MIQACRHRHVGARAGRRDPRSVVHRQRRHVGGRRLLRRQHLETAAARHGSPSRTSSTKVPSSGPTCCARAVRGPAPSVHQCDVWGVARGRDRPPWLQQPAQRESRRETWHRPVPDPQPRDTVAAGRRRRPWAAPPPAVETRPRLWKAG